MMILGKPKDKDKSTSYEKEADHEDDSESEQDEILEEICELLNVDDDKRDSLKAALLQLKDC